MPLDFSRNGTFMAMRKLHQNVFAWRRYMAEQAERYAAVMGVPREQASAVDLQVPGPGAVQADVRLGRQPRDAEQPRETEHAEACTCEVAQDACERAVRFRSNVRATA